MSSVGPHPVDVAKRHSFAAAEMFDRKGKSIGHNHRQCSICLLPPEHPRHQSDRANAEEHGFDDEEMGRDVGDPIDYISVDEAIERG
jgi:hypothetical protein